MARALARSCREYPPYPTCAADPWASPPSPHAEARRAYCERPIGSHKDGASPTCISAGAAERLTRSCAAPHVGWWGRTSGLEKHTRRRRPPFQRRLVNQAQPDQLGTLLGPASVAYVYILGATPPPKLHHRPNMGRCMKAGPPPQLESNSGDTKDDNLKGRRAQPSGHRQPNWLKRLVKRRWARRWQ